MANHEPDDASQDDKPVSSAGREFDAQGKRSAIELIRGKVDKIYTSEPDVKEELSESEQVQHRSKHQQFMYELGVSGKDLASIQTEWHNYYQSLSDTEKNQVWQEFYASQNRLVHHSQPSTKARVTRQLAQNRLRKKAPSRPKIPKIRDSRSTNEIQRVIRHNVTAGGKLKAKHHLQSILFGLGIGCLAVLIFMFGFFNEVFIAPFIQPSRVQASTPLIVSSSSVAPTTNPEVIIPKINVEIPIVYNETSTNESVIENDLQDGVVHYPTTVLPGENGNTAYFGHSSNNIFNQGRYKFAFVLLHTLVNGDTFYLTNNGKIYVYKVISHTIVSPNDVGVLGPVSGQTATATLITCDPPGTSINRLVVVGQQISPDPSGNSQAASPTPTTTLPTELPGNGQTLWGRFISNVTGKVIMAAAVIVGLIALRRVFYKQTNKLLK